MEKLDELKYLDELNSDSALRARYILYNLDNISIDHRKLRIKKAQYINWSHMILLLVKKNILPKKEIHHYCEHITKNQNTITYWEMYIRDKETLIHFLKEVDNAFLILLANLNYYRSSDGTRLYRITNLHPKHYEAIVRKLKQDEYTLPKMFKPLKIGDK